MPTDKKCLVGGNQLLEILKRGFRAGEAGQSAGSDRFFSGNLTMRRLCASASPGKPSQCRHGGKCPGSCQKFSPRQSIRFHALSSFRIIKKSIHPKVAMRYRLFSYRKQDGHFPVKRAATSDTSQPNSPPERTGRLQGAPESQSCNCLSRQRRHDCNFLPGPAEKRPVRQGVPKLQASDSGRQRGCRP